MAEPDVNGNGGQDSGTFGFLTRKIGPLPIWAWGAIAVGIYYWYTHYGPGATSAAAATPVATEKVVSSGGPTITTTHISHERPSHKRHVNPGGHEK